MKSIDLKDVDNLPGQRVEENETFCFECKPELDCFNLCCRNLNLFLYPYDVIRLKNRLRISSSEFIDRHADLVLRPGNHFPDVLLRMADNEEKTCPFLGEKGCTVYEDRPDSCRTFPMEQGMMLDKKSKKTEFVYFFRPPKFCLGQHEKKQWTPKTWDEDQNAVVYHKMTALWAQTKSLFADDPWGMQGPYGQKAKIAFMAAYNVDEFRDFVIKSTFLKRYRVSSKVVKKIKKDDAELMVFAFAWIKLMLWGIPSKLIKE